MEEKNLEQLKSENEILSQQLRELNEKVKGLGNILLTAKELNTKLVYSTKLFAEIHLTRNEKKAIAKELDEAHSAEQVEKIYYKYYNQIVPEDSEADEDFLWSSEFTRDMEKYFFQYKGYNPFEVIDGAIKTIRLHFKTEDEIRITEDKAKIEALKENWTLNREAATAAIDEVLSITNEILKK